MLRYVLSLSIIVEILHSRLVLFLIEPSLICLEQKHNLAWVHMLYIVVVIVRHQDLVDLLELQRCHV